MNHTLKSEEIALFQKKFGNSPVSVCPIPKSGSDRAYFRIYGPEGESAILCRSGNIEENKVFVRLCRAFFSRGANVPEILAVSPDCSFYLQTDLGSQSLFDLVTGKEIGEGGVKTLSAEARRLVESSLDSLVSLQSLPSGVWEKEVGFPPLGLDLIEYDFRYFMSQFVERASVDFDMISVGKELKKFGSVLSRYPSEVSGFMFRDFQSRNVMIRDVIENGYQTSKPFFIDFQSGRRGPCVYDLVSFVWQAKAAYTEEERVCFIHRYVERYSRINGVREDTLLEMIPLWALFRVMQVLGAYGLRGLKEKKKHFIESIPFAVKNLRDLLSSPVLSPYSALRELSESLFHKFLL